MDEMDRLLRALPHKFGFVPEAFRNIQDFLILKKAGFYNVEKMRIITLMGAMFNMNNKKIGREVM